MRATPVVSALFLLLAVTACSSEPSSGVRREPAGSPAGWSGTIEERDGVVRVTNPDEGLWEAAESAPIRFEPAGVYGGPGAQISSIAGAAVDRNGNLHIYDAVGAQLVALTPDGALLHRAGRPGSEADAFNGVRGMTYDGAETLWFANQEGRRLDAWSLGGTHLRSIPVADLGLDSVYMGGPLAPDRLALITDASHNMATNEYVVVDVSDDPAETDRFSIGAEPMVPIPPSVVLQLPHSFHEGQILVGTWEQYVLRAYDAAGALRRRVTRPVDYLRRPGFALLQEQYLGVALGGLAAPVVLADGYWLVLATWPTNVDNPNAFAELAPSERPTIEWASSLDLFDSDGRYLYSLQYPGAQTPDIGRPWTVGPDGDLYTVTADPFPQVRRYRVFIEPPAR